MQDRKTYAKGSTITTEGFRCSVGEPIDIKVTVGEDEEVDLHGEAGKIIPNGDHLITLEVNGEKVAYRDLYHLGDTVTVGDYTISDDMYLYGVSEGDEVVMRFEPVELMVTDAFRAAVKNSCKCGASGSGLPDYSEASNGDVLGISSGSPAWVTPSGGGTGGGVLVVHDVEGTLDHTWKEIHDAISAGTLPIIAYSTNLEIINSADTTMGGSYDIWLLSNSETASLSASSSNGYPTWN